MRLRGLLRKEIKHVLRDPSAILIAFLMPLVLLLVLGFGISFDANHMPVALVADAPDEVVRGLLQAMDASPYLSVQRAASMHDAEAALAAGQVRGIVVVREDFAQRLTHATDWPATVGAGRECHRSEHRAHPGGLCQRRAAGLAVRPAAREAAGDRPAASRCRCATGSTRNSARPMPSCPA